MVFTAPQATGAPSICAMRKAPRGGIISASSREMLCVGSKPCSNRAASSAKYCAMHQRAAGLAGSTRSIRAPSGFGGNVSLPPAPPPCGRGGATHDLGLLLEQRQILPVPRGAKALDGNEPQGGRVDAVALARGGGAVVEQVAEVRVGVGGADFGPCHQEGAVG